MGRLRILLIIIFVVIAGYTVPVVINHGVNLFPTFFGDVAALGWAGQFNVDFACFLALSATWVAWRHQFTSGGIALGIVAFFGGALFLSIYLLVGISAANGDAKVLLLGPARASS